MLSRKESFTEIFKEHEQNVENIVEKIDLIMGSIAKQKINKYFTKQVFDQLSKIKNSNILYMKNFLDQEDNFNQMQGILVDMFNAHEQLIKKKYYKQFGQYKNDQIIDSLCGIYNLFKDLDDVFQKTGVIEKNQRISVKWNEATDNVHNFLHDEIKAIEENIKDRINTSMIKFLQQNLTYELAYCFWMKNFSDNEQVSFDIFKKDSKDFIFFLRSELPELKTYMNLDEDIKILTNATVTNIVTVSNANNFFKNGLNLIPLNLEKKFEEKKGIKAEIELIEIPQIFEVNPTEYKKCKQLEKNKYKIEVNNQLFRILGQNNEVVQDWKNLKSLNILRFGREQMLFDPKDKDIQFDQSNNFLSKYQFDIIFGEEDGLLYVKDNSLTSGAETQLQIIPNNNIVLEEGMIFKLAQDNYFRVLALQSQYQKLDNVQYFKIKTSEKLQSRYGEIIDQEEVEVSKKYEENINILPNLIQQKAFNPLKTEQLKIKKKQPQEEQMKKAIQDNQVLISLYGQNQDNFEQFCKNHNYSEEEKQIYLQNMSKQMNENNEKSPGSFKQIQQENWIQANDAFSQKLFQQKQQMHYQPIDGSHSLNELMKMAYNKSFHNQQQKINEDSQMKFGSPEHIKQFKNQINQPYIIIKPIFGEQVNNKEYWYNEGCRSFLACDTTFIRFGQNKENEVQFTQDSGVSGYHCQIKFENGQWQLGERLIPSQVKASTNGTYVFLKRFDIFREDFIQDSKKRGPSEMVQLQQGMIIAVGNCEQGFFKFRINNIAKI